MQQIQNTPKVLDYSFAIDIQHNIFPNFVKREALIPGTMNYGPEQWMVMNIPGTTYIIL